MSHMRYIFELTVAHFWEHSIRTEAVPVVTCGVSIVIGFSFLDRSLVVPIPVCPLAVVHGGISPILGQLVH